MTLSRICPCFVCASCPLGAACSASCGRCLDLGKGVLVASFHFAFFSFLLPPELRF